MPWGKKSTDLLIILAGICPHRCVSGLQLQSLHRRVPQPNELCSYLLSRVHCLMTFSFEFPSANFYSNPSIPNYFIYDGLFASFCSYLILDLVFDMVYLYLQIHRILQISFSKTDFTMCIYHLLAWPNLNFSFHYSESIPIPIRLCLLCYTFLSCCLCNELFYPCHKITYTFYSSAFYEFLIWY